MGGSARRRFFAALASNVSPVQIVSGTYNVATGGVLLQTDGELAAFDDYPTGAWQAAFAAHDRYIGYVQGGGYEISLDTTEGEPTTGDPAAWYLATPPTILDVDGLPLAAQGPVTLTPA